MLGFWLYAVGAVFWVACALTYGARSPWWRSLVGRSLFGSWTALACVLILAALFRLVPLPHPLVVVLAVVVLSAVDIAGLVQWLTVLRLQRQDRAADRRAATPSRPSP